MVHRPTLAAAEWTKKTGVDARASGALGEAYLAVRRLSEDLCEPLETEDLVIQSMPDVSPTRWHLAHTTWFFETFVLSKASPTYRPFHPAFVRLFNSYYNEVGEPFPRSDRGLLSRPTVQEIFDYRAYVDEHMHKLLDNLDETAASELAGAIEIGLNHEQQHQELMLTDIKHVLSCNPLYPAYRESSVISGSVVTPLRWVSFGEGLHWVGYGGGGFSYDNERPRHRVFVHRFQLATRLVTNGEFLEFIEDRGYARPKLWLAEGWATIQEQNWKAPLYWEKRDDQWWNFTLAGMRRVDPTEPVCHVSYYEADAFARWAGAWLPFEAAWEVASKAAAPNTNFVEDRHYHPVPADDPTEDHILSQVFGDVWEWTCSPYVGYPGYRVPNGALGEYNGKFMSNQMVLRGGSCATPRTHIRPTYRNFFPPAARWQFTGIRLAREDGSA